MNKRIIRQTLLFAAVLSGLLLSVAVLLWPTLAVAAAQATPVPGTPLADSTLTPSTVPTHTATLTPTLAVSGTAVVTDTLTFTPSLKIGRRRSMVIDVNGNGQIDPGDTLRHTIKVTNQGDVPASEIKLKDKFDKKLITVDETAVQVEPTGDIVSWDFDLAPGATFEVSYDATLKSDLPSGKINVQHVAEVLSSDGIVLVTADPESFFVDVLPSLTPTPAPPRESTFTAEKQAWIPAILVALISLVTIAAVVYVGTHQDIKPHQIGLVREGIFLIFIVTAVLILAIDRGIPADGAISLLSAIAGYVFGRAWGARGE